MRLLVLIAMYTFLSIFDAATTVYLFEKFPAGREMNRYVDPVSLSGILLAPTKFIIYAVFLLCVLLAEKNAKAITTEGGFWSDAALMAYFPIFMIFTKVLAVFNNLMPMIGISTPISYVLMFMKTFPGDESIHYPMFWSVMFLLMAPLGLWVVKRIYRERPIT